MRALIMAGGEGRRLRPLTIGTPKPLLRVWDRPILEHLLLQLRSFGITDVFLAVAHLAPMIEQYFGQGNSLRMHISYLRENTPLGTAGALGYLSDFDQPILLINGDVLTDLDFSLLLAEHQSRRAVATIATKVMHTDLSLGIIDVDTQGAVTCYREKPRLSHRVGLGIYVVDPKVKKFIRPNQRIDMPELITRLLAAGQTIVSYEHSGQWIDIGTPEDYARVEEQPRLAVAALAGDVGGSYLSS